ncbi:MAG TPA: acyl-ACP--UDP-N-acetylglucosamine O-acyltransferase [Alphaproteobacteria bacterium]|nr:acyl-ACP--UDP-N-acetylglucosamine O-acyltransferase [Alphaproteobacteria bacterium]
MAIHSTAIVDKAAEIGADVSIGPYCVVGPKVKLGKGVRLHSHVVLDGITEVGEGTEIYPFASIGLAPQDLKYKGEPSKLVIGARNRIREHVTINPGTEGGGLLTSIGDDCLLMVGAHVAHDCKIGHHVILVNNATLAGHVQVGDHAIIGGNSAVHQFVRIGAHAMVGGMSGVENDVIPYGTVLGDRARLAGLNLVGLERRGFARDQIHALRSAYRMLFAPEGTFSERLESVAEGYREVTPVADIVAFIRAKSSRALCQPRTAEAAE